MTVWSIKTVYKINTMQKCFLFRVWYSVVKVPGSSPFYLLVADFFGKLAGVFAISMYKICTPVFLSPYLMEGTKKTRNSHIVLIKCNLQGLGSSQQAAVCVQRRCLRRRYQSVLACLLFSCQGARGICPSASLWGRKNAICRKKFCSFIVQTGKCPGFWAKRKP